MRCSASRLYGNYLVVGVNGLVHHFAFDDIFLAVGTGNPIELPQRGAPAWTIEALNDEHFDPIYEAAVQCVEEAVVNALIAAADTPTFRPPDHVVRAIDHEALLAVMRRYGRAAA